MITEIFRSQPTAAQSGEMPKRLHLPLPIQQSRSRFGSSEALAAGSAKNPQA